MASMSPIDLLPLWALYLVTLAVVVVAHEAGFRAGRVRAQRRDHESGTPVGGMVAAQLGLLAFLLAFTFGIATSRFDTRRQVLLDEVNAIGTVYLRAEMLPEAQQAEVRNDLREYVDIRIAVAQEGQMLHEAVARSEALQRRMWDAAMVVARQDPHSITVGLFIESLNDVIDLHTKRLNAALRTRIPMPAWMLLFSVAVLSFGAMGYQSGLSKSSRSPAMIVLAITFTAVLTLVADLDRSGKGLLRVSQLPMVELRDSMKPQGP